MPSGVVKVNQRKDLVAPCGKGCAKRFPGCHDYCQDPEYLEWRRLIALKRQDEQSRSEKNMADLVPADERYRIRK